MRRTLEDLGREIDRRWVDLGTPKSPEIRVVDLPQTIATGQLLLGVGADGSRLLVPFEADAHRTFKADRRSKGIQLDVLPLEERGRRYYLDVLCPRGDLRWLFTSFIADVLLRVARRPSVDPVSIVRTTFQAWRALFAGGGRRLSLKQLAGLFGELMLLERLLERNASATPRWRGPLREPHDFRSDRVAVEVKTTLATEDRIVHIHGLDQLTAPETASLYLLHVRAESPAEAGTNVPALVAKLLPADHTGRLPGLLAAAGYLAEHAESYESLTFEVKEEQLFKVGAEFPRLSVDSFPNHQVPAGLSDFRYSLDLATVTQAPETAARAAEVTEELLK
jgi:hypothetical protein